MIKIEFAGQFVLAPTMRRKHREVLRAMELYPIAHRRNLFVSGAGDNGPCTGLKRRDRAYR